MGEIFTKNFEKEQISTQHSAHTMTGNAVFMIDMRDLTPVGEFGSREWCEACASYGARILESGNMPARPALGLQRGLHLPTRAADKSGVASVRILLHGGRWNSVEWRRHSRRMPGNAWVSCEHSLGFCLQPVKNPLRIGRAEAAWY
ncbi:MAG: hypothetical protein CM15mP84_01000 [Cellvibrionales bacterium]|nr:MAG: hypothetical protein CM15mP84_01000 [Cellvibrionales bacterium]